MVRVAVWAEQATADAPLRSAINKGRAARHMAPIAATAAAHTGLAAEQKQLHTEEKASTAEES